MYSTIYVLHFVYIYDTFNSVFTDSPPLSLEEIISNHTVEPSVQVNCNYLCHKEPKCVGFNFRTKTDEKQPVNCQLTNTTRRKIDKTRGDWTLFYDVDVVCIFEMFVTGQFLVKIYIHYE